MFQSYSLCFPSFKCPKSLPALQDSLTKMDSTRIRWPKAIAAQNDHCCGEQIFPVAVEVFGLQFVIRWRRRHLIGNSRHALLRFHSLLLQCLTFHVATFKWLIDAEKEMGGETGEHIILKMLCIWNSISWTLKLICTMIFIIEWNKRHKLLSNVKIELISMVSYLPDLHRSLF